MYMAEVLEAVCQKRKLSNPKDYALVLELGPTKLLIPIDRTVKSLQGKRDLMLIKKTMLQTFHSPQSVQSTEIGIIILFKKRMLWLPSPLKVIVILLQDLLIATITP